MRRRRGRGRGCCARRGGSGGTARAHGEAEAEPLAHGETRLLLTARSVGAHGCTLLVLAHPRYRPHLDVLSDAASPDELHDVHRRRQMFQK
ncbi:hypothetical protein EJB05_40809, partial [Eragrostis curvula]